MHVPPSGVLGLFLVLHAGFCTVSEALYLCCALLWNTGSACVLVSCSLTVVWGCAWSWGETAGKFLLQATGSQVLMHHMGLLHHGVQLPVVLMWVLALCALIDNVSAM
jgi:hypothetical protein